MARGGFLRFGAYLAATATQPFLPRHRRGPTSRQTLTAAVRDGCLPCLCRGHSPMGARRPCLLHLFWGQPSKQALTAAGSPQLLPCLCPGHMYTLRQAHCQWRDRQQLWLRCLKVSEDMITLPLRSHRLQPWQRCLTIAAPSACHVLQALINGPNKRSFRDSDRWRDRLS
jgi:hypothetical protein